MKSFLMKTSVFVFIAGGVMSSLAELDYVKDAWRNVASGWMTTAMVVFILSWVLFDD